MGLLNDETKLVVLEAIGLILTDRFISPYFSSSEFGWLLSMALQAWIFLEIKRKNYIKYYGNIYNQNGLPASHGGGMGVGPSMGSN